MKPYFRTFLFALGVLVLQAPLSASGRSEGAIQKTWEYATVTTVIVDADRQDLVVNEGGPTVAGRLVGDTGDDVKATVEGSTLTLTVRGNGGWFSWRRRASRVELTVPAGTTLDLTTASGAILVQAVTASLRARSGSGDIEAPRGGKAADVDSTSGTVRLRGFSGPVVASALSGDLRLEALGGRIQAATLSGRLDGRGLRPEPGSRFTTVSGSASLELDGGAAAYAVSAASVSGRILVGDQSADNTLAVGSGPSVVVKSVSGDIRVR